MLINCNCCGLFEIGIELRDELMELPESHWQIERLREALKLAHQPVKIARSSSNIIEAEPLGTRLTKMRKRSLRKMAEKDQSQVVGQIHCEGESDGEE